MSEQLLGPANLLLTGFAQQKLYAVELKNELLERASREDEQQKQQQSQLARSTTENFTSYTNLSDGSGFSVDPNDLKRLDSDIERYKIYFSQIKLQWLETLLKRKTLQRLLGTLSEDEQDGIEGIITQEHVQMLEDERSKQKQALKASKAEAEELREHVTELAKQLDEGEEARQKAHENIAYRARDALLIRLSLQLSINDSIQQSRRHAT